MQYFLHIHCRFYLKIMISPPSNLNELLLVNCYFKVTPQVFYLVPFSFLYIFRYLVVVVSSVWSELTCQDLCNFVAEW